MKKAKSGNGTAMGDALKTAGVPVERAQLYTAATECIAASGGNAFVALDDFVAEITTPANLLVELIGKEGIRSAALGYLRSVKADMDGKPGAGGQLDHDAQGLSAPVTRRPNGGGAADAAAVPEEDMPSSSPAIADGTGHDVRDAQHSVARPVREPTRLEREAAGRMRTIVATTVLDSFRVRDGRSIGDVKWREIERLRRDNTQEAAVLRLIQRKVAHADPNAKVRELITPDELARMVQQAAEAADVL